MCGSLFFANFGEARSEGVEVEFSVKPIESLLLNASASYTDAQYTRIDSGFVGAVEVQPGDAAGGRAGMEVRRFGRVHVCFGDSRSGYLRADWHYVDATPIGVTTRDERPSYDILNASVGLQSGPWDVSLYVENVGNTDAVLALRQDSVSGIPGVFDTRVNARPRTAGILLRMRF